MFCTQCGTKNTIGSRFCANCGAAAKDVTQNKPPPLPIGTSKELNKGASNPAAETSMHVVAYLGLCLSAWIIFLFILNGFSTLLADAYADATVPTMIGFWAGKIVLKNPRRDWISAAAFPIFTLITGILGSVIGSALTPRVPGNIDFSGQISMIIAFGLSCSLFAAFKPRVTQMVSTK